VNDCLYFLLILFWQVNCVTDPKKNCH